MVRKPRQRDDAPKGTVERALWNLCGGIIRLRYLVVVIWVVAAVASVAAFPSLSSVVNPDNRAFLPDDVPSVKAFDLAAPFAPTTGTTAQLVVSRDSGPLDNADQTALTKLERQIAQVDHVDFVRSQGFSPNGRAALAVVATDSPSAGTEAEQVVDDIRDKIDAAALPPDLSAHLTGTLAVNVDTARQQASADQLTRILTNAVILLMLLIVLRSLLAPFVALLPAVVVLVAGGPLIAEISNAGAFDVSTVTQSLFTVIVLGAGTDYGLFLLLRMKEEIENGHDPRTALQRALTRVGESILTSGGTVVVALLCLLLATFGLYFGMGPALAIAVALLLLAALTLLPALLAIFGKAVFWPRKLHEGAEAGGLWGRVAERALKRPAVTLVGGLVVFGALAVSAFGYSAAGFGGTTGGPAGTDSGEGDTVLRANFPPSAVSPTSIVLTFPRSVWNDLGPVQTAEKQLAGNDLFRSVTGPLSPAGESISTAQLQALHQQLGPPASLPAQPTPQQAQQIPPQEYQVYRAEGQYISGDGRTVQFQTALAAGGANSTAATNVVPDVRDAASAVAGRADASDYGVSGIPAVSHDVSTTSSNDLQRIVPVVLALIGVLLGLVLRSLIAPLYLLASVVISFFAALGLAVIIFMWIGGSAGLNFVLPFLMFVFLMALGEDYNILVMSRIREEARKGPLRPAIARAIHVTGTTVTSAGLVLAATFLVVGFTGATTQIRQLGVAIALGVLLDTFLVRTLLVPSTVALLGRWNWWPSAMAARGTAPPPIPPESTVSVR